MAIDTKAHTTRSLVEAGGEGGKLLTLTIFQPHFNQAKRYSNVYSKI